MEYVERPYVACYDTEVNGRFRDAIIDELIVPAVVCVYAQNRQEDLGGPVELADEFRNGDQRVEYELYAFSEDEGIVIASTVHTPINPSEDMLALMQDELEVSELSIDQQEIAMGRLYAPKKDMLIETFVRRSYEIHLDNSSVRVRTNMGFSINEQEIVVWPTDSNELDEERATIFEPVEIQELVRALYRLELITEKQIQDFLDREF